MNDNDRTDAAVVTWRTARGTKRRYVFEPRSDGDTDRIEQVWCGRWREVGSEVVTRVDIDAPENSDFLDLFPNSQTEDALSHNAVEARAREDDTWPQYYVTGEDLDADDFVPAYYRVDGPNGPVSYVNPDGEPVPTTMLDFALDARSESLQWVAREDTPWTEVGDDD